MKKIKLQRKLFLNKEKVAPLSNNIQEAMKGGWTGMSPCYSQPTYENCVSNFYKCPWTLWNCGMGTPPDPGQPTQVP